MIEYYDSTLSTHDQKLYILGLCSILPQRNIPPLILNNLQKIFTALTTSLYKQSVKEINQQGSKKEDPMKKLKNFYDKILNDEFGFSDIGDEMEFLSLD